MAKKLMQVVLVLFSISLLLWPTMVTAEMNFEGISVGAMNYNPAYYFSDEPRRGYGLGFQISFGGPRDYKPSTKFNGVEIKSAMPSSTTGGTLSIATVAAISAIGLGVFIIYDQAVRNDDDQVVAPPPTHHCPYD